MEEIVIIGILFTVDTSKVTSEEREGTVHLFILTVPVVLEASGRRSRGYCGCSIAITNVEQQPRENQTSRDRQSTVAKDTQSTVGNCSVKKE